jgi:N-acylethanolamine-hydrolysing acid amidase
VTLAYKDKAKAAIDFYTSFVPQPLWWMVENALKIIWIPFLSEYFQEVEGMANYMDINLNLLIAMQFAYDLSAFCTSIIVADNSTGNVIHARNLDFLNPEMMRQITYEANFYRNGTFLYRATMFAGLNGVMTGERPNAFSISLNSRTPSNRVNIGNIILNIGAYIFSAPQVTKVIRDTLE